MTNIENKIFPNFVQGLVLTVCLIFIIVISYGLASIPIYLNKDVPALYNTIIFAISSLLYIPIIVYTLKKCKINIFEYIRYPDFKLYGILVLLALAFNIFTFPFDKPIEYIKYFSNGVIEFRGVNDIKFNMNFIISFIHRVIFGPILEEVFFRGILLNQFLKIYSPKKAIIFSSLLFVFCHLRVVDVASLFLYGLMIGYVFYKTNSIIATILLHSFSNLIYQFAKDITVPMTDSSLVFYFMIMFISIVIIYLLLKHISKSSDLILITKERTNNFGA